MEITNNKLSLGNIWIIQQMGEGGLLRHTLINCGYVCGANTLKLLPYFK